MLHGHVTAPAGRISGCADVIAKVDGQIVHQLHEVAGESEGAGPEALDARLGEELRGSE